MLCHLREVLPDDAIVTNGAGNYSAFVQRYYRYRAYPSQLAPTSGSMGYGLPAAIAAKLVHSSIRSAPWCALRETAASR